MKTSKHTCSECGKLLRGKYIEIGKCCKCSGELTMLLRENQRKYYAKKKAEGAPKKMQLLQVESEPDKTSGGGLRCACGKSLRGKYVEIGKCAKCSGERARQARAQQRKQYAKKKAARPPKKESEPVASSGIGRCACGAPLKSDISREEGLCSKCRSKEARKRKAAQDRFTANCIAAKAAGMSYGEYMARRREGRI